MKTLKFLILSTSILTATTALAQPKQTGGIETATADIVFKQSSGLSFTITPLESLVSGRKASYSVVASYVLKSSNKALLGVRWTPTGTNLISVNNSGIPTVTVKGTNDKNNITLAINPEILSQGVDSWTVNQTQTTSVRGNIVIKGDQEVAADTYKISMDGSVFNA